MKVIFNSSMPRACSTLIQNIFNQNPDFYATPTDGLIELIDGAQERFTEAGEFKAAIDQDQIKKAWVSFCRYGSHGYLSSITDKPNIVVKGRGWKGNIQWTKTIFGIDPTIIVMVRNIKNIIASFEKLHRAEPEKNSTWYKADEFRGTTTDKRVDMYIKNQPLALDIDRMYELIHHRQDIGKVLFIRAEDLTSDPKRIMNDLYKNLNVDPFDHDFDNVKQTTHENDIIHGLGDLHTIRQKVTPLKDDSEEILGTALCEYIDDKFDWYQKYFSYIS